MATLTWTNCWIVNHANVMLQQVCSPSFETCSETTSCRSCHLQLQEANSKVLFFFKVSVSFYSHFVFNYSSSFCWRVSLLGLFLAKVQVWKTKWVIIQIFIHSKPIGMLILWQGHIVDLITLNRFVILTSVIMWAEAYKKKSRWVNCSSSVIQDGRPQF